MNIPACVPVAVVLHPPMSTHTYSLTSTYTLIERMYLQKQYNELVTHAQDTSHIGSLV